MGRGWPRLQRNSLSRLAERDVVLAHLTNNDRLLCIDGGSELVSEFGHPVRRHCVLGKPQRERCVHLAAQQRERELRVHRALEKLAVVIRRQPAFRSSLYNEGPPENLLLHHGNFRIVNDMPKP
ncbi:hypothetical protein MTO96_046163 [Rhipicephalus appendiculatus]